MGVGNKRTLTKTRRKIRDLDQVKNDLLSAKHLAQFKKTKASEDLPGLGRHYCVECAKWFETDSSLVAHRRGKPHKRRLKQLKEGVYDHEAAEEALGRWIDNGKREKNPDMMDEDKMAT